MAKDPLVIHASRTEVAARVKDLISKLVAAGFQLELIGQATGADVSAVRAWWRREQTPFGRDLLTLDFFVRSLDERELARRSVSVLRADRLSEPLQVVRGKLGWSRPRLAAVLFAGNKAAPAYIRRVEDLNAPLHDKVPVEALSVLELFVFGYYDDAGQEIP